MKSFLRNGSKGRKPVSKSTKVSGSGLGVTLAREFGCQLPQLDTLGAHTVFRSKTIALPLAIGVAVLTGAEAEEERVDHIGAIRTGPRDADGAILKKYAAVATKNTLI